MYAIDERKETFVFDNARTDKRAIFWAYLAPPFQYNGDTVQVIDVRWKVGDVIHADTITLTLKGFRHNMKAFLLGGRTVYNILQRVIKENEQLLKHEETRKRPMKLKGLSKIEAIAFRAVLKEQGKTSDEVIKAAVIQYIENHFDTLADEVENA